jgi:hypothetical protein
MRYDPLFGALLVLMAADVLLRLLSGAGLSAIIPALMLWGIVTFRWWAWWLVTIGAALGLVVGVIMLAATDGAGQLVLLIGLATNGFVLIVLYARRDRFD